MAVGHYHGTVVLEHGTDVAAAGAAHIVIRHRRDRRDGTARPLLFCHAAGATPWAWPVEAESDLLNWCHGIVSMADGRYCMMTVEAGDNSWANTSSVSRYTTALAWLQSDGGAASGRAGIIGASMGGTAAVNVAAALGNDQVAGILGVHPTADLDWHRGVDGTAFGSATFANYNATARNGPHYSDLNKAYGGNGATPTDSTHKNAQWSATSPTRNPPEIVPGTVDVPYLALYNSADGIIGATSTTGVGNRVADLAGRFTRGEARAVSASASHNEIFSTPLDALAFLDSLLWT